MVVATAAGMTVEVTVGWRAWRQLLTLDQLLTSIFFGETWFSTVPLNSY